MNWTIKEIKERLQEVSDPEDEFLLLCQVDERKGVQLAVKQWFNKKEEEQLLIERFKSMNQFEERAMLNGFQLVAGVDEVGRGPLAGPVVAAAVILDSGKPIYGLNDSKKLSLKKRNELYEKIYEQAIAIGIGIVSSQEIDQYNILEASKLAMKQAISALNCTADFLLVDAVNLNLAVPQEAIIKGDMRSNSIAAASIIAKVTRDELMTEYDEIYPEYAFKKNAGYGTKDHLAALEIYGATPIHRVSFSPVKNILNK